MYIKLASAGKSLLILLLMALIIMGSASVSRAQFSGAKASEYSSTPIWIYGGNTAVRNVAVGDLNGDNVPDIIAGEYNSDDYSQTSYVVALNGLNGDTIWTFEIYDGIRTLIAADINGDNVVDALAGGSYGTDEFTDGRLHAINGVNGQQLWQYAIGSTVTDIAVGDFNGTGNLDVVAASFDDYIRAVNGDDGSQLWAKYMGSLWTNAVDVGDVNNDGIDDVAYAHEYLAGASYDNYLGVLDGSDGGEIWELTLPYFGVEVVLADIDNDSQLEAVFGCLYGDDHGEIMVRSGLSGDLEWSYDMGAIDHTNGSISFTVCDYDEDFDLDLAVGNFLNRKQVLIFDGDVNTPMFVSDTLSSYPRQIVFGDVDDDKNLDIVAAAGDRAVIVDAFYGQRKWYYAVSGSINSVACGDFDNDGVTDIAGGGGAEYVGFPGYPQKTVWALKTISTPLLWEYEFGEYGNALTVVDLNQDGHDDVITASSIGDNALAIDGKTGEEVIWNWIGTENLYAITHGDFDNDGQMDVAVAGNDDRVTAIDGSSGDVMWQFDTPADQIYRSCLTAADLNGDGAVDVIAGTDDSHVYAINGITGVELWNCPAGADVEEVTTAQMNGSGPVDVVAGLTGATAGKKVIVIDGGDGSILWEYVAPNQVEYVEVMDVNNDDINDIALGVSYAPQQVIMVDGNTHDSIWTAPVYLNSNAYALGQGDINGDGVPDVIAGGSSSDTRIFVFNGIDGSLIWSYPVGDEVECVLGHDVDGDGADEVVAGAADNILHVIDGNGDLLFSYSTADVVKHIQVGDISADGEPNIACLTFGSNGVAYAFKSLVPQPNTPPLTPFAPSPADQAVNVQVDAVLSWSGGDGDGDPVTYDVYLGTVNPPPAVSMGQSSDSHAPAAELMYETEYFWRIVAHDLPGDSAVGPVWNFKTEIDVICADCNDDLEVNVSDAVFIINYVFVGGDAPDPLCSGDASGDGEVNVSDAVHIINYVFVGGDPPVSDCCD